MDRLDDERMGIERGKKKKNKENGRTREADCRMGKTGGDVLLYTVVLLPIKCGALVQWQKRKKKI
jgi:hypothetical protein